MKKSKVNYDGGGQLPMEFDNWIPVSLKPTKASLGNRLAMAVSIIKAGDADYSRLFALYNEYDRVSRMKHTTRSTINGEWVEVSQAKAVIKFLDTWKSRRQWLSDEVRDLQNSLGNFK